MLLGVTLTLAAGTVAVGTMFAYGLLKKGRGKHHGDIDSCLASCTCKQKRKQRRDHHKRQYNSCERHDQELLCDISKLISKSDLMWELGIHLGIKVHIIESTYEDNKGSINKAAFLMLHRWYTDHQELKVADLKHAMNKVHLGKYNEEIIDKHFVNRRQGYLDT